MGHYLIERSIPAPGRIMLTCLCGWSEDGTPDGVHRAWVRHSGEATPSAMGPDVEP